MNLRCIIIDDDELAIEILKEYILKTNYLNLEATFNNITAAINQVNFNDIDLIFLDVEMPEMTGIEFLESHPRLPPVIITSKKKEYGADAFNYNVIDFLHKPYSFARFMKAVDKAREFLHETQTSQNDNLFIKTDHSWTKIPVKEIVRLRADNDSVLIYTEQEKYRILGSLKSIIGKLPRKQFMQIHRSHVVQLNKIDSIDGELIEINKRLIPVSKTYLKELHERLNLIK